MLSLTHHTAMARLYSYLLMLSIATSDFNISVFGGVDDVDFARAV